MSEEKDQSIPGNFKPALGLDDGTYTLVCARRDDDGKIRFRHEVNGFVPIEKNDRTKMMLKMIAGQGIPYFAPNEGDTVYLLGKKAHDFAFSVGGLLDNQKAPDTGSVFRRTMKDGILSVKDSRDSFNILNLMIQSIASPLPADNCPIAFAVPGPPINREGITPDYHKKVITQMLVNVGGKKASPFPVNEAMAIIWAECANTGYTGLSMSWGAGMTNVCFSLFGMEIFTFSFVGGGDWIDASSAAVTNEDPVTVNKLKNGDNENDIPGIDLIKGPRPGHNEHIERALINHYETLVEKVVEGVSHHIKQNKQRVSETTKPEIVIAGGTASPNGFIEFLESKLSKADFGDFKFGEVRKAKDNLFTVSKGLLIAAEQLDRD